MKGETAAAFNQPGDSLPQVVELEREAGPDALALAAAVNAKRGPGYDDFAPDFGFETDHSSEQLAIKPQSALPIRSPQHLLHFLNLHAGGFPYRRANATHSASDASLGR
jgi:hypothetical protein